MQPKKDSHGCHLFTCCAGGAARAQRPAQLACPCISGRVRGKDRCRRKPNWLIRAISTQAQCAPTCTVQPLLRLVPNSRCPSAALHSHAEGYPHSCEQRQAGQCRGSSLMLPFRPLEETLFTHTPRRFPPAAPAKHAAALLVAPTQRAPQVPRLHVLGHLSEIFRDALNLRACLLITFTTRPPCTQSPGRNNHRGWA